MQVLWLWRARDRYWNSTLKGWRFLSNCQALFSSVAVAINWPWPVVRGGLYWRWKRVPIAQRIEALDW